MQINFVDQFLSKPEQQRVYEYCLKANYRYGEQDTPDYPATGMIHNISGHEFVYKLFSRKIEETFDFLQSLKMYRMYVNCFAPGESSYFHIDHDTGYTLLYYPHFDWSLNDGGETQFYIDENLQGILPVPNRLSIFDASILHRATSFRNRHRFTVAIKYR
jgi:hypothetical protein